MKKYEILYICQKCGQFNIEKRAAEICCNADLAAYYACLVCMKILDSQAEAEMCCKPTVSNKTLL